MNSIKIFPGKKQQSSIKNLLIDPVIQPVHHERCLTTQNSFRHQGTQSQLDQSSIYRKELHYEYGFYAVTPKIIISDLLFFCMIPSEYFHKVDTIISINSVDGVSGSALWCGTQRLCAMVVFRKLSFGGMLIKYVKFRMGKAFPFLKKLH